jgi:hypothetical protein
MDDDTEYDWDLADEAYVDTELDEAEEARRAA